MPTREIYEKLCQQVLDIRENVFESLKDLVKSMGNKVSIPNCIDDYCYNAIAYNGGNHPEYASDCFCRFEIVEYDSTEDSIFVTFEDDYVQELSENSIDDVLVVFDALLYIKEYNLIDKED